MLTVTLIQNRATPKTFARSFRYERQGSKLVRVEANVVKGRVLSLRHVPISGPKPWPSKPVSERTPKPVRAHRDWLILKGFIKEVV